MSTHRTSTKKTPATLGLYIEEVREHGYYHVRATAVWVGRTPAEILDLDMVAAGHATSHVPADRIRNVDRYSYSCQQLGGLDLDNLLVNSQGHDTDEPRRLYGWEVEYRDLFSVNASQAERMAKTLRTIERKLEKLNDTFGRPDTFAAYLLRVANAIGATRLVFAKDTRRSSYSEREHQILELRDGGYKVERLITAWVEERERAEAERQAALGRQLEAFNEAQAAAREGGVA